MVASVSQLFLKKTSMEHLRHVSSKQVLLVTYTFKLATNINPIQDGGEAKNPPYPFSPCDFYKRRNYPQKLYDF